MNPFIIIPLVFFTINVSLVAYIAAKSGRRPAARAYIAFAIVLALWEFSELFLWSNLADETLIPLYRITAVFYMLPGILFLNFIYVLLSKQRDMLFHFFSACAAGGIILANGSDLYFPEIINRYYWGNAVEPGPLMYPAIMIAIVTPAAYGILLVLTALARQTDPRRKRQFATILVGFTVATGCAVLTNVVFPFLTGSHLVPHLGSSVVGVGSVSMFIAIARFRLLSPTLIDAAVDIFSRVHDSVLIAGGDGIVIEMNETAARTFVPDRTARRRLTCAELFGDAFRPDEDYRDREITMTIDGRDRFFLVSQNPIGGSGQVPAKLMILKDITEMRLMEAELSRSSRIESLGVFAGGIAHDFNNLLTAIMGNLSMVRLAVGRDPESARMLAEAEKAAIRAADLTRQLLTFSEGGAPRKQVIALGDLLRESVGFALSGSRVAVAFDIAPDLMNIEADPGQIGQVLHNLVLNAVQAMPEGGSLTVRARNLPDHETDLSTTPPGPAIHLSVTDTGRGIPDGVIGKIFDPFFTTRELGTGLGLSIAYSIITKHGGRITASSRPGAGARFDIVLPATDAPLPEETVRNAATKEPSMRILVVDDEPQVLDIARRILGALGHRVATALNGTDAVAVFREALDAGERFDCVITDLTIPGEVGGIDVVRRLTSIDPGVIALVSSGYSNDPVMADHRRYGFAGIIPKPYRVEDIKNALVRFKKDRRPDAPKTH